MEVLYSNFRRFRAALLFCMTVTLCIAGIGQAGAVNNSINSQLVKNLDTGKLFTTITLAINVSTR